MFTKGVDSAYTMGYLYGWLFHEAKHSCLPEADNAAGGADPKSCLHLALDNTAHGEACSKAASIKGNDCDSDGGEEEGKEPEEPEGEGEQNTGGEGESQSGEQSGGEEGGEGEGNGEGNGLTPEEIEELEGLCDFMQEMQEKWTNDEASECITGQPLSAGAQACGISYPPGPSAGAEASASSIGNCGCC